MRKALLPLLFAALVAAEPASAGLFEPVRSRDPLPAREVERSPVLPMGWTATTTSFSRRQADERRLDRVELDLRHGLGRRLEGWLQVDRVEHRTAPDVAGDKRSAGLGNADFGLRGILAQRDIGGTWLAWEAGWRAPIGNDHPGTRFRLPLSAPPRGTLALVFRQRAGALRVDIGALGGLDVPGTVGVGALPPGCTQGSAIESQAAWLGAGGAFEFWGDTLLQGGPLLVSTRFDGALWTGRELRIRRAEPTGEPCATRVQLGTGGLSASGQRAVLSPAIGLQLSRGLALRGWIEVPLAGSHDDLWTVERIRGPRQGLALEGAF